MSALTSRSWSMIREYSAAMARPVREEDRADSRSAARSSSPARTASNLPRMRVAEVVVEWRLGLPIGGDGLVDPRLLLAQRLADPLVGAGGEGDAEVAFLLQLVHQRRDLPPQLGQAAALLEGLGVADQGADAEAGQHQEGNGRDDQDGDQLRSDAPVAEADRPTRVPGWRRRRVHTGGSLPLSRDTGWRRIILSRPGHIRHDLGVLGIDDKDALVVPDSARRRDPVGCRVHGVGAGG